jgi:hypothetical protein
VATAAPIWSAKAAMLKSMQNRISKAGDILKGIDDFNMQVVVKDRKGGDRNFTGSAAVGGGGTTSCIAGVVQPGLR